MLLGFFTYKIAVIGRQGLQEMRDFSLVTKKGGSSASGGEGGGSSSGGGSGDESNGAMTLDRIFGESWAGGWVAGS
jgi:hypothetical protein